MINRFIPLAILIAVMILGLVLRILQISKIDKRLTFTYEYRGKFMELINRLTNSGVVNNELYFYLTENVTSMQVELGHDGIMSSMIDRLHGVQARDYQMLINFLPEVRGMNQWMGNSIMQERFMSSANTCDDMFIRHTGNLKKELGDKKKNLFNPFTNLTSGIRWIISLPANILLWCGFISLSLASKLRFNWITKLLTFVITIAGLLSSVVTVVVGWEQTIELITKWLRLGS